jgi:hypothetical protein
MRIRFAVLGRMIKPDRLNVVIIRISMRINNHSEHYNIAGYCSSSIQFFSNKYIIKDYHPSENSLNGGAKKQY